MRDPAEALRLAAVSPPCPSTISFLPIQGFLPNQGRIFPEQWRSVRRNADLRLIATNRFAFRPNAKRNIQTLSRDVSSRTVLARARDRRNRTAFGGRRSHPCPDCLESLPRDRRKESPDSQEIRAFSNGASRPQNYGRPPLPDRRGPLSHSAAARPVSAGRVRPPCQPRPQHGCPMSAPRSIESRWGPGISSAPAPGHSRERATEVTLERSSVRALLVTYFQICDQTNVRAYPLALEFTKRSCGCPVGSAST